MVRRISAIRRSSPATPLTVATPNSRLPISVFAFPFRTRTAMLKQRHFYAPVSLATEAWSKQATLSDSAFTASALQRISSRKLQNISGAKSMPLHDLETKKRRNLLCISAQFGAADQMSCRRKNLTPRLYLRLSERSYHKL